MTLSLARSQFLMLKSHGLSDRATAEHRRATALSLGASMDAPRRCPRCSSDEVARLLYGTPSPDLLEEARAGRVALGADVFWPEAPQWLCVACANEWREEEEESGPL